LLFDPRTNAIVVRSKMSYWADWCGASSFGVVGVRYL
jgi:hypothetical protein